MKTQLFYTFWIVIFAFSVTTITAQPADRYDRDIRIAEGIIAELFEPDDPQRPIRGRYIREVSGRYIPGYGVHFQIGANLTPATVRVVLQGHAEIQVDDNAESDEIRELGQEFVEERLMEYLKNYASLFRDLPDDEVVRLTFGPHHYGGHTFIIRAGSTQSRRPNVNLTAWASGADIRAYDSGSVSEREFESRVERLDLREQQTERDQTVFASILQTALDEVSDQIRVRQAPVSEYLPGLGLSYSLNASLRTGSWFNFDNIQINEFKFESDSLSVDLSEIARDIDFDNLSEFAARVDSIFGPGIQFSQTDSQRQSLRDLRQQLNRQQETLTDEELREQVDLFHSELIRTLQDYGSTLRSLGDDEMLLVSIHWSGRHSALPQRSEIRIRKSDLLDGTQPEIEEYTRR